MESIVTKEYIVYDFEMILGLDSFYRDRMKKYEVKKLLPLIKDIFQKLEIIPKEYPVEGYYYENDKLKSYFNHIRTLQEISIVHKEKIQNMLGYKNKMKVFGCICTY